ncbi:hypothetical protein QUB08_13405 [Microcoleus sp. BR0-C5]|uniref:hypothetical protein n=1 Tax=Microcoleus sp. BR0-C5 TaxID=2818713 RepID=UPI002FD47FA0
MTGELLQENLNLKSKIQNLKSIDGGPPLRLRCENKAALLKEQAAHVAQKSSCTAQSCYQQQWTANRQTDYSSLEANGEF